MTPGELYRFCGANCNTLYPTAKPPQSPLCVVKEGSVLLYLSDKVVWVNGDQYKFVRVIYQETAGWLAFKMHWDGKFHVNQWLQRLYL